MKKLVAVALLMAMVFILCACGAPEQKNTENIKLSVEEGARYAEWVYSATPGDLESADPYGSTTARTEWLTNMTFDKLIAYNEETGEMEPELATKWESNEAKDEWTFYLRNDVYFHNGDHLTAEDVKFTYLHTANLGDKMNVVRTFAAGTYAESVEVIDEYTVKFVLKQPRPDFPMYMDMKVYSKNAIETLGQAEGGVIGTGPYFFDKANTVSGQIYTVSRNENYWRGTENYKTKHIGFKVYGDWNGVIAALQSGDIDFTTMQSAHYRTVKSDPNLTIDEKVGCTSYYMGYNYTSTNADMNDPEVRIAIAQCINKDDMVAIAWEGLAVKSDNFCAPTGLGYSADVKSVQYNPEQGAATLKEKGITSLTIIYTSGAPAVAAEVIQASLKQAGIDVTLRLVDTTNWASFKAAREGYDLFVDYGSYRGALLYNFNRFIHRDGANNYTGFASDEYETLQNNVSAQRNWDDMLKEFKVLQQWVADNVPLFPLAYTNTLLGRNINVGGGYLGSSNNGCNWSTIYKLVK
ncbi:MAG: ABC transporter substrate-binding protein [Clostridia bacterium]|nr:ABC transporter substrate-binding protein [Clostridia bacterium]